MSRGREKSFLRLFLCLAEKCSEICKFESEKGFASKSGSFEPVKNKLYKMLAFECLNFTLGGSLIRGLVRKLAIRHPQNQCKIFTLGGSLIPSLCRTRPINSETEDFVRQAVDGLGERDSPSRLPLEPPYFFFDMASEILPLM